MTTLADPIPRLRDYRLSRDLTPDALAEQLGRSVARIAELERGKATPTGDERAGLMRPYGIDAAELDRALRVTRRKPKPRAGEIVEMGDS